MPNFGSKPASNKADLVSTTLQTSTIHGVSQLLKSKRFSLKLMWTSLLLTSLTYSSYLVYQNVSLFKSYPVVSLTRVNYMDSIDLPIITICNLNPFASTYSKQVVMELQNNQLFDNSNSSETLKYQDAR